MDISFLSRFTSIFFIFAVFNVAATSIKDVAQKAIETSPVIKQKMRDLNISAIDVEIAESNYLPSVDLEIESAHVKQNYGLNEEYGLNTAALNLTQLIFDGFLSSSEVSRLDTAKKVRYFELLDQIQTTALESVTAYVDVVLYRELLTLAEENLKTHISVYKQVEASVSQGVSKGADLEQISGRLSLAEANVMTAQSNLHDVSARYLRVNGFKPAVDLKPITNDIETVVSGQVKDYLVEAFLHNPQFLAALNNIEAEKFSIKSAEAQYYPNLRFNAGYSLQDRDESGLNNSLSETRVGLRLTYNLFNGGRDSSGVKKAVEQVELARDIRDQLCRDITQTVQITFNELTSLKNRLSSLNEHRLSSSRVRTAYLDQFKIGSRTLLDLLDSENEAYEASRAYIQASHELTQAFYNLQSSTGNLLGALTLSNHTYSAIDVDPQQVLYSCPDTSTVNASPYFQNVLTQDSDSDGVVDIWDECANSNDGAKVDATGCDVEPSDADNQSESVIW